ncbi:MAG TPA: hypothetical protein VGM56_22960 [Byssovorax sp.]
MLVGALALAACAHRLAAGAVPFTFVAPLLVLAGAAAHARLARRVEPRAAVGSYLAALVVAPTLAACAWVALDARAAGRAADESRAVELLAAAGPGVAFAALAFGSLLVGLARRGGRRLDLGIDVAALFAAFGAAALVTGGALRGAWAREIARAGAAAFADGLDPAFDAPSVVVVAPSAAPFASVAVGALGLVLAAVLAVRGVRERRELARLARGTPGSAEPGGWIALDGGDIVRLDDAPLGQAASVVVFPADSAPRGILRAARAAHLYRGVGALGRVVVLAGDKIELLRDAQASVASTSAVVLAALVLTSAPLAAAAAAGLVF